MAAHTCRAACDAAAADRLRVEMAFPGSSHRFRSALSCAEHSKNRRTSGNVISDFHLDVHVFVQHNINAGAKFDESDALSALDPVAGPRIKDDPARKQAGDLLEDNCLTVSLH